MAYQILDKAVYTTTQYLICGDDGNEYQVKCHEDDFMDYWSIWSDADGDIEAETDLGSELIRFCMNHENDN
jgi:hypothetical protein